MYLIKIIFTLLIISSGIVTLSAQGEYGQILNRTYLEYIDHLPANLISEKCVGVLIADNRQQGEKMAEITQPVFAKSGIDAVAYYHIDDFFAGKILSRPLANELIRREVVHLIFLIKKLSTYRVVITPFSKDENFVKHGKKAWQMKSGQLTYIVNELYRMSASLDRKNFLISDTPEFGRFHYKVKGRRYEAYKPDLKSEKLVVPLYSQMILPQELEGKRGFDKVKVATDNYNKQIIQRNEYLRNAFKNYPYPHVFIEEPVTEKQLISKGFNYVLHNLHATSNTIRDLLKYQNKQGFTDYVAVRMTEGKGQIIRLKGDAPAYKYYVRSISADTYYLGAKWDADITREAALNNHVQLLTAEIR